MKPIIPIIGAVVIIALVFFLMQGSPAPETQSTTPGTPTTPRAPSEGIADSGSSLTDKNCEELIPISVVTNVLGGTPYKYEGGVSTNPYTNAVELHCEFHVGEARNVRSGGVEIGLPDDPWGAYVENMNMIHGDAFTETNNIGTQSAEHVTTFAATGGETGQVFVLTSDGYLLTASAMTSADSPSIAALPLAREIAKEVISNI